MAQFQVADVLGQFNRGQQVAQQQQAAQQQFGQREQAALQQQQQFANQQQLAPLQLKSAELGIEQQKNAVKSQLLKLSEGERVASLTRNVQTAMELKTTPDDQKAALLTRKINEGESAGRDMSQSKLALEFVNTGRFDELSKGGDDLIQMGRDNNLIKDDKSAQISAGQSEFENLISDFTPQQQKSAKLIKAGLKGRAMSNAVLSAIQSGDVNNLAEANATIKQAEKFGAMTGASRAKAIDSGFDKIQKINVGISNLDKGIELIKSGAGSGSLERLLPSIKASTVALNNLQNTMALDVIGAVTFGALSQGELDLAKTVALNTRLDGPDLILDLQSRKAAQEKLRNYFNEQIQFLDQGGTVAGFLRSKEREQPQEKIQAEQQAPQSFNSSALGRAVSEQDISDTLQANPGLTREQLMQQLGVN